MNDNIAKLIAALTDFAENLNEKTLGKITGDEDKTTTSTGNQDWNETEKKAQHERDDRLAKKIAEELEKNKSKTDKKPSAREKAQTSKPKDIPSKKEKAVTSKPKEVATTKNPWTTSSTSKPDTTKEPKTPRRIQSVIMPMSIQSISPAALKQLAGVLPNEKISTVAPPPVPEESGSWLKKLILPVLLGIGGVLAMFNGLFTDGPDEETGLMKILSKLGISGGVKMVAKLFGGPALKVGGKLLGWATKVLKPVISKIPVIGSLISWAFAWKRLQEGDIVGGIIDIASGIATLFPGIGTGIAVGLDILNAWLDMSDTGKEVKEKSGFTIAAFATKAVAWAAKFLKPVLKRIPLIGTAISFMAGWERIKKGDTIGGLIDFTSGIATMLPGLGTGISMGLDVLNMWLDNSETGAEVKKSGGGFTMAAMVAKAIAFGAKFLKPVLKRLPLIGTALSFMAGWDKFKSGNVLGGAIDFASGIAMMVPGLGTGLSLGLDVLNMWLGDPGNPDSNAAKTGGKMSDLWNGIKATGKKLLKSLGGTLLDMLPGWMKGKVASFLGLEYDGKEYDSEAAFEEAQKAAVASQTKSLEKTGLDTSAIKDITGAAVKAADRAGGKVYELRSKALIRTIKSAKGDADKFRDKLSETQILNIKALAESQGRTFDDITNELASGYSSESMFADGIDDAKEELIYAAVNTATGLQLGREKTAAAVKSLTDHFKETGVTLGEATLKLDKSGKINPDMELTKDMWKEVERLEKSTEEADKWYLKSLEETGVMDKIRAEREKEMKSAKYNPLISESNPTGTSSKANANSIPVNNRLSENEPTNFKIKDQSSSKPSRSSDSLLGPRREPFASSDLLGPRRARGESAEILVGTETLNMWDENPPIDLPIASDKTVVMTQELASRKYYETLERVMESFNVAKGDGEALRAKDEVLYDMIMSFHNEQFGNEARGSETFPADRFMQEKKKIDEYMSNNSTPEAMDFIWRPGQKPLTFSKGDILIGSHEDNLKVPAPNGDTSSNDMINRMDKMVELMTEHSGIHTKVLEVLTESGLIDKQGNTVVNNGGNSTTVNNSVAEPSIMDFRDRVVGRLSK